MRAARSPSSPNLVQRPLRARLQMQDDLRTRLRHLLRTGGEACTRSLPEVLRTRSGPIRRGE